MRRPLFLAWLVATFWPPRAVDRVSPRPQNLETRVKRLRARQARPRRPLRRANIEALLGVVRKAALVTFGVARPDLYRKVTSQYQRDARRACRTRAKSEPPPRKSSVVGAVVGRRKRGAS